MMLVSAKIINQIVSRKIVQKLRATMGVQKVVSFLGSFTIIRLIMMIQLPTMIIEAHTLGPPNQMALSHFQSR